jgi:hypothetical protein
MKQDPDSWRFRRAQKYLHAIEKKADSLRRTLEAPPVVAVFQFQAESQPERCETAADCIDPDECDLAHSKEAIRALAEELQRFAEFLDARQRTAHGCELFDALGNRRD